MVIPQGLRHSLPSSENTMTARQKIQAKIDSEVFIIPKRDDTKRFQPSQVCELYSKLFGFINRVDNVNWPPSIFSTADISSVSPFVRTDARNVDFRNSLRWPDYIINSGDKTKSSYNTPADTASLQPYPLYSEWFACDCCDNIDLLELLSLKLSLFSKGNQKLWNIFILNDICRMIEWWLKKKTCGEPLTLLLRCFLIFFF